MTFRRRSVILAAGLSASVFAPGLLAQIARQAWPTKPIRLVVPTPAGGQTDAIARLLGQRLTETLGQPVIIENKPGANTLIATEAVANSTPDGYTLLLTFTVFALAPLQYRKVPYDPFKDFVPISRIGDNVAVFAVPPSLQVNTLKEFIALAKTSRLSYGSPGSGSTTHMYGAIFAENAGLTIDHIPYKGESNMLPDLTSNRVNSGFISALAAAQFEREGKLKLLAVNRARRSATLPDVPTFIESGVPDMDAEGWVGILAPAGVPKPIVERLASEIDAAVRLPEVRTKLLGTGLIPMGGTAAEFSEVLRKTHEEWSRIVQRTGIRME